MSLSNNDLLMEIDQHNQEEDSFLALIEYARSVLWPEEEDSNNDESDSQGPGWSWIASRILRTCTAYSSGVTFAILLSDLAQVTFYYF